MASVEMSNRVAADLVESLGDPIPKMHLSFNQHTPHEIKLGCGDGSVCLAQKVMRQKDLSQPKNRVYDIRPFGHTHLKWSSVLRGHQPPSCLRIKTTYILWLADFSIGPVPASSSYGVSNPKHRDHSLSVISISWLKSLKQIDGASRSVVCVK